MDATARTAAVGTAAVAVCAAVGVHAIQPSSHLTYLGGLAVATAIAWAGVLAQTGSRYVSALIAAAVSVSVLGDVIEIAAEAAGIGLGAWLAAALYFTGYLILGAALLGLLTPSRRRRRLARLDALLEAATIVTVAVLLVWTASTTPAFKATGLSVAEGALQVSTPIADLILVIFAARAIVIHRGRSATGWLLATGMGTWLLTSVAFVAAGHRACRLAGHRMAPRDAAPGAGHRAA